MTKMNYAVFAGIITLLLVMVIPVISADSTPPPGYITVGLEPVANFNAVYSGTTVPAVVVFQDQSTGSTPLTYAWDFGDGATSTDQNPQHTYLRSGLFTVSLTVTNAYGTSTETKASYIGIGLAPNADFSGAPTTGNAPLTVVFTDRSTGYPTSWNWDFGDGQTSTEQNPVHIFWAQGNYAVTLTVTNDKGTSTITKQYLIHVLPGLKSIFTANPKFGVAPLVVGFTDMSTGNPQTWTWNFGDSTSDTTLNPVHTYTNSGVYVVTLTVTNGVFTDSSSQAIVVGGVPVVNFVADNTTVDANTPVHFTDLTFNSPISWNWDFGDGLSSTIQNPTEIYTVDGVYNVTLTATNDHGQNTLTKVDYITVGVPPTADFTTAIPSFQVGSETQYVQFTDTSIGNPVTWLWNFGDGTTYSGQKPPLHLYNHDGSYTVSLTVTNPFGQNTKTESNLITVRAGPLVDFMADRTNVSLNEYVHFTDLSGGNPTSWSWNFGDGSSDSTQNPYHAYNQVGVYSVTLTASDGYIQNTLTKKDYITVTNLPGADFVGTPTRGISPFTVMFTDKSVGNPTGWTWNFGDGTTSNEQNPSHVYSTSGNQITNNYTVSLTATNAYGADTETKVDYIQVTQTPIADFTVSLRQGKAPFVVTFQDLSQGSPSSWAWDFGDGTTSTEQNPTHTYPFEGSYDVRLTATNQYGSDTVYKTGTTSTRNNGLPTSEPAPVPYVIVTPQQMIPAVAATTLSAMPTTAMPTTSQAPVSTLVPVTAVAIGMLAIVAKIKLK
jgi:PKD repeat protein